jgi:hypothetical protein
VYEQDLSNIERGYYRAPHDMNITHRQFNPLFILVRTHLAPAFPHPWETTCAPASYKDVHLESPEQQFLRGTGGVKLPSHYRSRTVYHGADL